MPLDETHDPARPTWVASARGHVNFPIQNLPLGASDAGGAVAIGDSVLLLGEAADAGLLEGEALTAARAGAAAALNPLLALGAGPRRALRRRLSELLSDDRFRRAVEPLLRPIAGATMRVPATIGDYTDFYAGIYHATNVGRLFRPDQPLLPNYKYVPIGYHGRASTVRASDSAVPRPSGQVAGADGPVFTPTRRLDHEVELALWIGPDAPGGVPIARAGEHVAGIGLLNDWSARDVQAWEYQPLGPFLAKSFATSVSPWIVTAEALEPFRRAQPPRPAGDPAPLPHLSDAADQARGSLNLTVEAHLSTAAMRARGDAPVRISRAAASDLYWTPAQLVAHHASNGCALRAGDLLGTGTISGPGRDGLGSLLEITRGGAEPLALPGGETRLFLQDGDEVILTGRLEADGFVPIGLGECRGVVGAGG